MRICYLVLVHHKFDQAARMIRRLAGPDCGFVLHIDRNADPESIQRFRADRRSVDAPATRSRAYVSERDS